MNGQFVSAYHPPCTTTPNILNRVAAISEAIGRLTVLTDQSKALRLRRINRIRTIHDSLAIEGNTLLAVIQGEMSRAALQTALGLRDRKSFHERYLKPALADGLMEMTLPDKPNSRLQKYRLTDKGGQWLAQRRDSCQ